MNKKTNNSLIIYLIKEEVKSFDEILSKNKSYEINGVGSFFCGTTISKPPKWISNFFINELNGQNLFNKNSWCVLLVEVEINEKTKKKRIFAIPFGYGHIKIEKTAIEERFGLKTALNLIDHKKIRKIGNKTIGAVAKDTNEQLTKVSIIEDFGLDIEKDLLSSITGQPKEKKFGEYVSGKDSLALSVQVNVLEIKDFLKEIYKKYMSEDYKEKFDWIDQMFQIQNPKLQSELNSELIKIIHEKIPSEDFSNKIWLSVPEIIDWSDIAGFSYNENHKNNFKQDINLRDFIFSIPPKTKNNIDIKFLKRKKIYIFDKNEVPLNNWTVFNCISCEIYDKKKKKTFILNDGKWFEINENFTKNINDSFDKIKEKPSPIKLPNYVQKKGEGEKEYNEKVANENSNFLCLDRKNIMIGGGKSRIEFCDLYTNNKEIVHIKRYGSSSVLSHLFSQALISAEIFLSEEEFRKKLNNLFPDSHKISNISQKPKSEEYSIILAIITSSKKSIELPFFSKVNIKNTKRRLEAFGYKVFLHKIETEDK